MLRGPGTRLISESIPRNSPPVVATSLETLTHAAARTMWGTSGHHRMASRFLDELGAGIERQRLSPTSWSSYGHVERAAPSGDAPDLATGDTVRHGTLGDGIVTRIESGGVVTVRFASDSSERRLILEYAPLEKIA